MMVAKLMGWFFLIVGSAILLVCVGGFVYAIVHGLGEAAAEFGTGIALFGGTPWIGFKMLRESSHAH